jgi:hypothetical protein
MSSGKTSTASTSAPDLDILGDQITIHPGAYVEPLSSQNEAPERNLVEHMARFREAPLEFLREVSLHVSGTGWRAYDDFIGQPIFYRGFSESMKVAVLQTRMLKERIEELAAKRVKIEEAQGMLGENVDEPQKKLRKQEIGNSLQEVASNWTDSMICKLESKNFIRGAYYLSTQLLTRAYHQGMVGSVSFSQKIQGLANRRNSCLE